MRTILVPVDFSVASCAALELAIDLAERWDAKVHVLHVLEYPIFSKFGPTPEEARPKAERQMKDLLERHGGRAFVTHSIVEGDLAGAILSGARTGDYDLIAIGEHRGPDARHLLLGEWIIRNAPCPVLVARERL